MSIDIAWFPDYGHLMAGIFYWLVTFYSPNIVVVKHVPHRC